MNNDESIRIYEAPMPEMPKGRIPITGGIQVLRVTDPLDFENPIPFTQESVEQGKIMYGYYCKMCHGPKAEGYGIVGQSFNPLPPNLTSHRVQIKSDGFLFYIISLGQIQMPPLAYTLAEEDRWLIINYLRSLARELESQ